MPERRPSRSVSANDDDDDEEAEKNDGSANGGATAPPLDEATRSKLLRLRSELGAVDLRLSSTEQRWCDDACLLRFLRARNLRVSSALRQLREAIAWRREFGVERLMAVRSELAGVKRQSVTGKMYVHGRDRLGRPAMVMKPHLQNTSERDTAHEQIQHLVYTLERAIAAMEPPVEKLCLLIDFAGYSLRTAPSIKVQRRTLKILQDYYPERLGAAVCVDAPRLFWVFYKLIRPFIDEGTARKIHFCDRKARQGAAREMAPLMQRLFDASELEADFGGRSAWTYSNATYFAARVVPRYVGADGDAIVGEATVTDCDDASEARGGGGGDEVFYDAGCFRVGVPGGGVACLCTSE